MHPSSSKPWYRILYIQVLIAVVLGVATGYFFPAAADDLKKLGDGFIRLVKMLIAPVVFCTVVHGIASMSDLRKLGRIGWKALLYFEVISTLALIIGLVVVNVLQPGVGFTGTVPSDGRAANLAHEYSSAAHSLKLSDFILNIIPTTVVDAFAKGDLLQVLLISLLSAFALNALGKKGEPMLHAIDTLGQLFFGIMGIIVKLAPLGAFGAMAYTVGTFGLGSLASLLKLMAGFYLTAAVFIFVVLGLVARAAGFSIIRFLVYIKEELLLVLGTSSSETALPNMIAKMQRLGCAPGTVGLVIPTGYSFNLDGTNIYMAMAAVFLAQATHTPLTLGQQISLLIVAMLTSKGASGITGAGFVTLAATLEAVKTIPIESLALLVGIDRFMSECRSITNLIGNGVATVAISRWENEVSPEQLREALAKPGTEPL